MMDATQPRDAGTDWHEQPWTSRAGIAAYVRQPAGRQGWRASSPSTPKADIANAFNHKQVGCKMWARDKLFESCGGRFGRIWVLGGWYGVLPAMLFDDARFDIAAIDSIDIDPAVAPVARTLNREAGDRFRALTGGHVRARLSAGRPDLVVNTSCEHIADLRALARSACREARMCCCSRTIISASRAHINCVASLAAFEAMAALSETAVFRRTADEEIYPLHADRDRLNLEPLAQDLRRATRAFQIETDARLARPASACSIACARPSGVRSFSVSTVARPSFFEHQGANRLFGFPAGCKWNEQRATTRAQDIADRIVARLRDREAGAGQQAGEILAEPEDGQARRGIA